MTIPEIEFVENEKVQLSGNFSANLIPLDTSYFKGENVSFRLSFTVSESPIRLNSVTLKVKDSSQNRSASQSININQNYPIGNHNKTVSFTPGFSIGGFIALTNKTYQTEDFSVNYQQALQSFVYKQPLIVNLMGSLRPLIDQMAAAQWSLVASENATVQLANNLISIQSLQNNGTVTVTTKLNFTGYPRIHYNITGLNNSAVNAQIDSSVFILDESYIPIGNVLNEGNLTLSIELQDFENITIDLTMETRKIVVFAVFATNHWEGRADDNFTFRHMNYYLDQVNVRFHQTFNLTFLPVASVEFQSLSGPSLSLMRSQAQNAAGTQLNLGNDVWSFGTGTQEENAGADVLIVFTNKTMDHLGIVYLQEGTAGNLVINARGSQNAGDYRLPSVFADNLVQHELSHVFGARDRFTDTDLASVMTKSRTTDDAFEDFALGQFWLMLTYWLEVDIQRMTDGMQLYG